MSLADHLFTSKLILFTRRNIFHIMACIFLLINRGDTLSAFRASFSLIYLKLFSRTRTPEDAANTARYLDHYSSAEYIDAIAHTLVNAGYVLSSGVLLIWMIDLAADHRSLMDRELRHLRKWTRDEFRLLDQQARLLSTLSAEQSFRHEAQKKLIRLEAIVLRYEKIAAAYNPSALQRDKLSEKEDSMMDLFSAPRAPNTKERVKEKVQKIIFNTRT